MDVCDRLSRRCRGFARDVCPVPHILDRPASWPEVHDRLSTTGKYVIHTTVKNASSALTTTDNSPKTFDRAFWTVPTSPNDVRGMSAKYRFSVYGGYLPDSVAISDPDGNIVVPLPVPTRDGYTFRGWYTETNGQGIKVDDETVVSATSNQTLYAYWTSNTQTITFDRRSGSGGTSSVTATFGQGMPTATMPTRTGYTFSGYYDAVSGGTQYYTSSGASARNWDRPNDTTLYAHWATAT